MSRDMVINEFQPSAEGRATSFQLISKCGVRASHARTVASVTAEVHTRHFFRRLLWRFCRPPPNIVEHRSSGPGASRRKGALDFLRSIVRLENDMLFRDSNKSSLTTCSLLSAFESRRYGPTSAAQVALSLSDHISSTHHAPLCPPLCPRTSCT